MQLIFIGLVYYIHLWSIQQRLNHNWLILYSWPWARTVYNIVSKVAANCLVDGSLYVRTS